jgi:branched-chain amino acid transport system permease protein
MELVVTPELFSNLLISIVLLASIYALVNVGMVLLYRSTGVVNFAQGHLMMLAAFMMVAIQLRAGYWPSFAILLLAMALVGALIYAFVMRFLVGASEFAKVITTLMLSIVLTQFVAIVFGGHIRRLVPPTNARIDLFGGMVLWSDLIIVAMTVILVVALMVFLGRTMVGSRLRALAGNEALAGYAGLSVHRLAALAWAIATAGAAVAGVAYAQHSSVNLSIAEVGLGAFPAAVIGGLNSIGGTMIGALLVAVLQTLTQFYLGAAEAQIISYGAMLLALIFIPHGLFGRVGHPRL